MSYNLLFYSTSLVNRISFLACANTSHAERCGLYFKHIPINDNSSFINSCHLSVTDNDEAIIYYCNMFIILATDQLVRRHYKCKIIFAFWLSWTKNIIYKSCITPYSDWYWLSQRISDPFCLSSLSWHN